MKRLAYAPALALCAMLVATSLSIAAPEGQPAPNSDQARIRKLLDSHVASFNQGDWKAIQQGFDSDALLMHQFTPDTRGPEAIAALFRDDFKGVATTNMKLSMSARVDETQVVGAWAYQCGVYTYFATDAQGGRKSRDVRFLDILKKQPDGSWKFSRSIDNTSTWPYAK